MGFSSEFEAAVAPLKAELAGLQQQVKKKGAANPRTPNAQQVFGVPSVRKGENPLTSRGYMFTRLLGYIAGLVKPEDATVELGIANQLKSMADGNDYKYFRDSTTVNSRGTILAPLGAELMLGNGVTDEFRHQIKSMTMAGVSGADPDQIRWMARKSYADGTKASPQSWIDATLGGDLVAPPEFGELIQLLRNKDAMMNAGARVVPMPASGRLKYPRQTSATTGYWVGENTSTGGVTASSFGTGSLNLEAKKCAVLVTLANELIRFGSPAAEAILRADMTKTLSLTFDKACLEGPGTGTQPLGVINTPGIVTITPTTVAADGNTVSPQDLYAFLAGVAANNAEFQGFILRPEMFYNFVASRTGVYTGSGVTANGQFTFSEMREMGQGFQPMLGGYPATTTAQVSQTRVKGNGVNLTYILGGQWDDAIMALFGSIEYAQATQGDAAFANDQTVVRAILTGDFGLRHAGAFAVMDNLLPTIGA